MQVFDLANGPETLTNWNAVNWRRANRRVRNLRYRIFRATREGNLRKVHNLQKLMLRSYSNALLSVRRVTQVNKGRVTAGVDKLVVKTPTARGRLVDLLSTHQPWRSKPVKRVYIPKSSGTLRPLGIPTVLDRCLQAMVKNSLEPHWEARFEGTSYGFRPGRGAHDAISKIYLLARPNKRKKWVVDADITGAFDNIDHTFLLNAIGPTPGRELIKQWLKAGYVDKGTFHPTDAGTPQGGVISPLLANIALHGMEDAVDVTHDYRGQIKGPRAVVRYADDFVVFCESQEDAERAKTDLGVWLKTRGLTLSPTKTQIVHLTHGFNFLGFTIRHYPTTKTPSGYKLLITPSKDSVKTLRRKLRLVWRRFTGTNLSTVINTLNPIIRGWANYFRIGVAAKVFGALDHWIFTREIRYAKRTHPTKPWHWKKSRYWGRMNKMRNNNWVFGDKQTGKYLLQFSWFHIHRHTLVPGLYSPDDPSLKQYWLDRSKTQVEEQPPDIQVIAKRQGCRCLECGEALFNGEELHMHHIQPRAAGGTNALSNKSLLHLYCHQRVHSILMKGKVYQNEQ